MERGKESCLVNTFDACRAYLAKVPPAISGQGGHPATFRAACECVRFGLGDSDAMTLLREYNRTCSPPWSESELAHKLADARRKAGGQLRAVRQPRPAVRVVWKIARKAALPPPAHEPAKAALAPPTEQAEPLKGVWIVKPGKPIPAQFVDVLRTWTLLRQDAAWMNHPQITSSNTTS